MAQAKSSIDLEAFVQAFVLDKAGPAEAYRRAGYQPRGDNDNAALLAQKYMRRPEVAQAIEDAQKDRFLRAKQLTVDSLLDMLENDLPKFSTKDRGDFLIKASKELGFTRDQRQDDGTGNLVSAIEAMAKVKAILSGIPAARTITLPAIPDSTRGVDDGAEGNREQ